MIKQAKKPIITLRLTNDPEKRVLVINTDNVSFKSKNPSIGKIAKFEKVKLTFEPLLWP